jgi:tetratricopeptide (TPR) repeat protein
LTGNQVGKKKTITRARADVFKLQDDLAKEVALALRSQLGNEIESVAGHPGTSNAQAWEALQQAKQTYAGVDTVLSSGGVEPAVQRLSAADSQFAAIEGMDKKWVAPVVMRGFIAHRKFLLLGSSEPKWLNAALGHADRAMQLAPENSDALELRGTVRYFRWAYNQAPDPSAPTKLLDQAEADFRAAVKANPLQATAWNGLSYILNAKVRFSEAKLAAQQGYDSDPYLKDVYKTIWRLFQNSIDLNNRTEAEKWCNVGRERVPDNYRFTECRLWLYTLDGQKPRADSVWAAYQAFVDRSPANVRDFNKLRGGMLVALGLLRAGLPDSARHVAEHSRGNPQIDPGWELPQYEAKFRAQLGDKAETVRLLRDFFANNPMYLPFAKDDRSWWWEKVKDDPSYKELIGAK